jgi:hypothetical protein
MFFSVGRGGDKISRDAETPLSQQHLKVFSGIIFFCCDYFHLLSFECWKKQGRLVQCPLGGYVETHQLSPHLLFLNRQSRHAFMAPTHRFSLE